VTRTKRRFPVLDFLRLVHWLDGTPILPRIEAYRRRISMPSAATVSHGRLRSAISRRCARSSSGRSGGGDRFERKQTQEPVHA
jgi:hypothetical protein